MPGEQQSYRQIMKATSLFGGVQVFNIIIGIVRSKFIAVLLGPVGMGVAGLLTSTINLITSITSLGLSTSAVKNVSEANAGNNKERISTVVTVINRLVWITGITGAAVTFLLAPLLSKMAFDNYDYSVAFRWVSVTLLFTQLTSGRLVMLQGMRKLRFLAKANMAGSVAGLLVSVPVYYWLGVKGIVPAIVISAFITLLITLYFSSKVKIDKAAITSAIVKAEGSGMLKMGVMLSLSGLINMMAAYLLGIFISKYGGVEQVGLYNAGFAIINTYVGMIFTAMATDYFPRLSEVANDNSKVVLLVNQQAEIAVLIIAPILILFMVFINAVVILLYSARFLGINEMIQLVALGIFLKTVTWSMGFIILAKGDSKTFFYSELVSNVYTLCINMLFFKLYGLNGIGISFLVCYFLGMVQVYAIIRNKYKFVFKPGFFKIFSPQFLLATVCFLLVRHVDGIYRYLFTAPLLILSIVYSFKQLNKKMNLITLLSQRF
jgi:O-antigen/teichoic acid export membrane protein